ncbi:MAG: glycine cleavage system aminomethyltransferase GcvT [Candidatus Oleimicrobiaceae bacterium]
MEPKKTGLYEVHQRLHAKMVPFAGYWMPIQYTSIVAEHRRVRSTVGVFDVSHMGEFVIRGPKALEFLERMTINQVSTMEVNRVQYSAMCYPDGGIVDDLLVYRLPEYYMMVVNASNLEKDFAWLLDHLLSDVSLENISDEITLLAVQGRYAQATLQKLTSLDLSKIKYYWAQRGRLAGVEMLISRTGYTGEDGFEIGFERRYSEQVWEAVMEAGKEYQIEPIGLGARDSLRLEMKYCLYGNDIDQTTNPLEAGLGWITKLQKRDFIGREALLRVKEQGLRRKLVGFEMRDRAIPRHGYAIVKDHKEVGRVTSGTFSPSLEKGIGMGYVPTELAEVGSTFAVQIRGQEVPAVVVQTPFYKRPY